MNNFMGAGCTFVGALVIGGIGALCLICAIEKIGELCRAGNKLLKLWYQRDKYHKALKEISEASHEGCENWTPVETLTKIDGILCKALGEEQ